MVVYWILDTERKIVKVGQSSKPMKRLKQLQTGNPDKLVIVGLSTLCTETELHELYKEYQVKGEWFEWNELIAAHCRVHRDHFLSRKYRSLQKHGYFDPREFFWKELNDIMRLYGIKFPQIAKGFDEDE